MTFVHRCRTGCAQPSQRVAEPLIALTSLRCPFVLPNLLRNIYFLVQKFPLIFLFSCFVKSTLFFKKLFNWIKFVILKKVLFLNTCRIECKRNKNLLYMYRNALFYILMQASRIMSVNIEFVIM